MNLDEYIEGLFEEEQEYYRSLDSNMSTMISFNDYLGTEFKDALSQEERIYLESRIKYKMDRKLIILDQIEKFFEYIIDSLLNKQHIEFPVIDIQSSSFFDYDKGTYKISEKTKVLNYHLNNHSGQISQITYLLQYFYYKLSNCQISSKREIFYSNVEMFKSMSVLNKRIIDICYIFDFNRFDLEIYPSEKGLFSGDLTIKDEMGNIKFSTTKIGEKFLISHNLIYEEFILESSASFILVVEKDTVFFTLNNSKVFMESFPNIILITAKGFPDYLTRLFIKRLISVFNIPALYLGDFDPFGLGIYLTYLFGSRFSCKENKDLCINNLQWIGFEYDYLKSTCGESQHAFLKLQEIDINKAKNLLSSEIFNMEKWKTSNNYYKHILLKNLVIIKGELENMLRENIKAECEIVLGNKMNSFIEILFNFLNNEFTLKPTFI